MRGIKKADVSACAASIAALTAHHNTVLQERSADTGAAVFLIWDLINALILTSDSDLSPSSEFLYFFPPRIKQRCSFLKDGRKPLLVES